MPLAITTTPADPPRVVDPPPHESVAAADLRAKRDPKQVVIVGVGASAGGLGALEELVRALVPDDMLALVVVQHLAPHHESLLTQLLSRATQLSVVTAVDGTTVEPNHVYVIPPNADLVIESGVLGVTARAEDGGRFPIDAFFRTLAEDCGDAAVGIILSGTGSDGTAGLKAIKVAGGTTFIQEPSTAQYDGMPRSALADGGADYCLSPALIAEELGRLRQEPRPKLGSEAEELNAQLARLFVLIRAEFRNDLSAYKPATIERRIQRRMRLHKLERLADYVKLVEQSSDELEALYRDTLIGVTSFFRDQTPIEALKRAVFPRNTHDRPGGAALRVWVPACATGEEAYSIAIAIAEFLEAESKSVKVQIFATDVDDEAIAVARRGAYPESIALAVSAERLARFFVKREGGYQISRRIRDMVVFSTQNLLQDAPFSRIDLVSCRNVLIYLLPAAQRRALDVFHYALSSNGCLLLGASESIGDAPHLFSLVDRKNKIYSKKHAFASRAPTVEISTVQAAAAPPSAAAPRVSIEALADRAVLDRFAPPGVIVDEQLHVSQFRGRMAPYLDPAPGQASFDLLRLLKTDLRMEVKGLVKRAFSERTAASAEVVHRDDSREATVVLTALPLQTPDGPARCVLVLFEARAVHEIEALPTVSEADERTRPFVRRVEELEHELALTRQYLQTTIEEKESTHEELKSANEELQSSNEELQSINEELETSKEETQSTNEELVTVNDELNNRMGELGQTNDDLHNVLAGVDNAVVIVGMDLRIRRWTTAAERLLETTRGGARSVEAIGRFVGGMDLVANVRLVIETLSVFEEDVLCDNGRYYAVRIAPYKTLTHEIRGAVVSLTDVDVRRRASDLARSGRDYAAQFLAAIGHPLLMVDARFRVVWANEALREAFQLAAEETVGSLVGSIGPLYWDDPGLVASMQQALATGKGFRDFALRRLPLDGASSGVTLAGSRIIESATAPPLLLLSLEGNFTSFSKPGGTVK